MCTCVSVSDGDGGNPAERGECCGCHFVQHGNCFFLSKSF